MTSILVAGAAAVDITPEGPQFLFGYPHVARISTGVHDRLLSSSLCLHDGQTALLFVANDVIAIGNETARRVRRRIEQETGVPAGNILITASHTHSGPMTFDLVSCQGDAAVPKTDPAYVRRLEEGIIEAALSACRNLRPAAIGLAIADGSCVGTNRHDPAGPSDPQVPILVVRDRKSQTHLAAMAVCSMHPTVLHEDSTLVSGDFPAMTRKYLQEHVFGMDCPVLYHTGPSGNQSPRHVAKSNTFDEASRLGGVLGRSIAESLSSIVHANDITLGCAQTLFGLPARRLPTMAQAREQLEQAARRLETLRLTGADGRELRTAECDWFGAEETLTLTEAAANGRLQKAIASAMPAEVTLMRIGPWFFAGWPGEAFVEFSLQVKASQPNCHVISLANGELQGYVVTEEAVQEGWYEAGNALFANPDAGLAIVENTLKLLQQLERPGQ
jgi:hypothetical protein